MIEPTIPSSGPSSSACLIIRRAKSCVSRQRRQKVLVQKLRHSVVIGVQRIGDHHLPAGIHKDIDPLERIDRRRKQVRDGQLLTQVTGEHADVSIIRKILTQFRDQLLFVHIREHDIGIPVREMPGDGQPDTVRGPGDNRSPARDGKAHDLVLRFARARGPEQFECWCMTDFGHLGKGHVKRLSRREDAGWRQAKAAHAASASRRAASIKAIPSSGRAARP